jgi:hypothetical protein
MCSTKNMPATQDPREQLRMIRLQLRTLHGQYSLVSNLYQLAGEYATLCDQLVDLLAAQTPSQPVEFKLPLATTLNETTGGAQPPGSTPTAH